MDQVVQALRQHEVLVWAWRLVVWASVAYLFAVGLLIFVRPAVVMRFFEGFASSARINTLEAVLRLVIGLAFMAVSRDTKFPVVFFGFGAVLVVTAIPLMFLYGLHTRQRVWVIPLVKRILPLMGLVAIVLGLLIAWALI
jgi:hypothetical protein